LESFLDAVGTADKQSVGTPVFMAPELVNDDEESVGPPADVYSFAVSLYSMFAQPLELDDNPRLPRSTQQLMMRVFIGARFQRKPGFPDPIWELIRVCWKQNPESRPTFSGIVDEMKSSDRYVLDGTDISEYHEYRARRLLEAAPSVGPDCHSELATLLGWSDLKI
jgi:serine/threonine-protein kinase